ncbi:MULTISPECIES: glycosyltransferase family 39 protein [unclassified Pseudomonas]|uniref:glycosyltransferase family 39 protein n=1 Tax=unclassified Pseudomonas TaxID=196821 RepID=UPI000B836B2F|nr:MULTISPECIES: glycosyltransferase family 39 protein [unclassified Pseudomonas]
MNWTLKSRSEMSVGQSTKKWPAYLPLAGAVLFGCYLRLHNIDVNGLWVDEAFSVATSDPNNSFIDVYKRTLIDVHPPFYQVLLWLFYKVFGYTEMSGRYLSVFIGVLLIPSVFCLGWQMINRRTGLICSWLVAVNFYFITYSQETRSYALLVLLAVLSFVFFISLLRSPTSLNVVLYALVMAMLVNTHYFGLLPVGAQVGLFFLIYGRKAFQVKMMLKFLTVGAIVFLTLLPSAGYIENNLGRQGFWIPAPQDSFFIQLFTLYFGNASLSIIAAILMALGLVKLVRDTERKEALWVLVLWVGVCVMVPYVRSIYIQPVLTMRNLIVVLPALLIMTGYGLSLVRDKVFFYSVIIAFFCFSMTPLYTADKPVHSFENQLPPKSLMRDVLRMMVDRCAGRSIYSGVSVEAQGYAKILDLPLKINSVRVMERDIESAEEPLGICFFNTSGIFEADVEYMKKHHFKLVRKEIVGNSSLTEYQFDPK